MGYHYTPRNWKEFALYGVGTFGAIGLISLGAAGVSVAIDYHMNKKVGSDIGKQLGIDIKILEELYLYNDASGCKVVARCSGRSDEIILVEYNISVVDYVKLNDDDTDKIDFFRNSIIPNYKPVVVTEDSLTQSKKNIGNLDERVKY